MMNNTDKLELLVKNAVLLSQPVDAIIALPHPTDSTTDGVGLEGASHTAGRLVDLSQVDLNRSVVLGRQNPVTRGALPWDVHVDVFSCFVLHGEFLFFSCRSESSNI